MPWCQQHLLNDSQKGFWTPHNPAKRVRSEQIRRLGPLGKNDSLDSHVSCYIFGPGGVPIFFRSIYIYRYNQIYTLQMLVLIFFNLVQLDLLSTHVSVLCV